MYCTFAINNTVVLEVGRDFPVQPRGVDDTEGNTHCLGRNACRDDFPGGLLSILFVFFFYSLCSSFPANFRLIFDKEHLIPLSTSLIQASLRPFIFHPTTRLFSFFRSHLCFFSMVMEPQVHARERGPL